MISRLEERYLEVAKGSRLNFGIDQYDSNHWEDHFQGFLRQGSDSIFRSCQPEGRIVHLISSEQFTLPLLDHLCDTADAARYIVGEEDQLRGGARDLEGLSFRSALECLGHKRAYYFFDQASTRTLESFMFAADTLGMPIHGVRDPNKLSVSKGGSYPDLLKTLALSNQLIIARHHNEFFPWLAVYAMNETESPASIINAGSGDAEHPTQALLDYYTARKAFGGDVYGKNIVFVGNCARGRAIKSFAKTMALTEPEAMYFVAPEHLQIDEDTQEYLGRDKRVTVIKTTGEGLREVLKKADIVYLYKNIGSGSGESPNLVGATSDPDYTFTTRCLEIMKEDAIVMHPMQRLGELPVSVDRTRDPRLKYWEQPVNGLWVRTALLAHIFEIDDKILRYRERLP